MRVRVEIGARTRIGLGVFDLLIDRVGIDHDARAAGHMLVAQPRRAAEIDERIGIAIEIPHRVARQAVIDVVDGVPVGPAMPETIALHHPPDIVDVIRAIHHHAVLARIVGVGTVILDIPGLVAQPLQPDDVMHGLPGDARQRHLPDEMKNDDPTARPHGNLSSSPNAAGQ
jgi:hypothetical protein